MRGDGADPNDRGTGLVRALGPGMATALVVGNVIGAGIFLKPGQAVAQAGSVPVALAAWAAGGLLCMLGALTIAELGLRLPQAGGLYVYLREGFGRPVAFLFGWTEFVFGMPASIGALAAGSALQIGAVAGRPFGTWDGAAVAVGLIVGLAAVNVAGVLWGGRAQFATTAVKCLFLAALAALPFGIALLGGPGVDASRYSETVHASGDLPVRFSGALLAVLWTYNGWHVIAPVAEEVRDPRRNIPIALVVGSTILIALYLAAVLAYHGALPTETVVAASREGVLPQTMTGRLLAPFGGGVVSAAALLISLAVFCSMAGSLNASLISGPRVGFAMARDGLFPGPLAAVHPRFRTPAAAIVTRAAMSVALVLASAALVDRFEQFRERTIFDLLSDYVTFTASLFLMLAVAAIFPIRRRGGPSPGYVTPLYPWVPLAYVGASLAFVGYVFAGKPAEAGAGILLSFAGLPVYFWMSQSKTAPPPSGGGL
ncbi:MAG TPA: amino acid permease [Planctomycetaceae bacterium]